MCLLNRGKISDALLAIVMAHPEFETIKEYHEGNIAYCKIKRKNQPEHTTSFSDDDAKLAGLANKQGPWTQYPKRMRQLRARAFALRNTFPDALRGVNVVEEVQDYKPIKDITPKNIPSQRAQAILADLNNEKPIIIPNPTQELLILIENHQIPAEKINKWLDAAKVENIHELSAEQTEHCIRWIKKRNVHGMELIY